MEISGQSFGMDNKHVISLDGICYADVPTNSIVVVEGGLVMAKVSEKPFIGGFQLEFVSISRVINHINCYKFSALIG